MVKQGSRGYNLLINLFISSWQRTGWCKFQARLRKQTTQPWLTACGSEHDRSYALVKKIPVILVFMAGHIFKQIQNEICSIAET